jgi:hypothetical protein
VGQGNHRKEQWDVGRKDNNGERDGTDQTIMQGDEEL